MQTVNVFSAMLHQDDAQSVVLYILQGLWVLCTETIINNCPIIEQGSYQGFVQLQRYVSFPTSALVLPSVFSYIVIDTYNLDCTTPRWLWPPSPSWYKSTCYKIKSRKEKLGLLKRITSKHNRWDMNRVSCNWGIHIVCNISRNNTIFAYIGDMWSITWISCNIMHWV